MDVNHCFPQISVAQEKLNRAQVGAGFQQVGGEAVAQGVRMKGFALLEAVSECTISAVAPAPGAKLMMAGGGA